MHSQTHAAIYVLIQTFHRNTFCPLFCLCSDVAIGAPKEDDYAGAVYIYHGDPAGIISKYSMVRSSSAVKHPNIESLFSSTAFGGAVVSLLLGMLGF